MFDKLLPLYFVKNMDRYSCDSNLLQIEDDSITMKELSNSIEEIVNTPDIYLIFKPTTTYDLVNKVNVEYPITNDIIINEIVNNEIELMSSRSSFEESNFDNNLDDDVLMKPEFSIINEDQSDKIVLTDRRLKKSKHKKESLEIGNTKNEEMLTDFSVESTSKIIKKSNKKYSNLIKMYCTQCNKVSINNYEAKCGDCQTLLLFKCVTCNSLYRRLISIHNHIKYDCFKGTVFYCNECNFESTLKMLLIKHIQLEHSDLLTLKVFKCSICQKKFKNQNNMLSHERVCSNELVLKCKHCPFKSRFSCVLTKHVQSRHQKFKLKIHSCPDCGKKYEHLKNLNRHIIKFCGKKQLKFDCDHCDYTINRKYYLAKHIQQSHSEIFFKSKFLSDL